MSENLAIDFPVTTPKRNFKGLPKKLALPFFGRRVEKNRGYDKGCYQNVLVSTNAFLLVELLKSVYLTSMCVDLIVSIEKKFDFLSREFFVWIFFWREKKKKKKRKILLFLK